MNIRTHLTAITTRILAGVGIYGTESAFTIRWPPGFLVWDLSRPVAVVMLTLLFSMHLWSVLRFPYFGPISLVEESAGTYTSANNYLKYGFLNSGFLQDFSNGANPADHPYVYDHFPPGPDILTALALKASGGSYRFVRILFAAVFLAGIAVYLKFVQLVLNRFGLTGAGYAVLFLGPWMLMQNLDRLVVSPQPLLIFGPLVALDAYYRKRERWYLYLGMSGVLVSSLYLEHTLVAVIFCWVFLYLLQLVRIDRRHLLAFLGLVGFGIALHLLQNLLYLGPSVFFRELWMLLSNRILGYPSQEALNQFYRSVGLVNHGAHAPHLGTILYQLWLNLTFAFPATVIGLTAAMSLAWAWSRCVRYDAAEKALVLPRGEGTTLLGYFGSLTIWICGAVSFPIILFPAFAQEVNLYGSRTHLYFLAVAAVAALAYTLKQIVHYGPTLAPQTATLLRPRWLVEAIIWAALILGFGMSIDKVVHANLGELRQIISAFREYKYTDLVDLRHFAGHLYMTNINTPTVGFFVNEAGFGACDLHSLPEREGIDPSKCKVADVRQYDSLIRWAGYYANRRPKYFFLFFSPDLFPGFANCLPTGTLPGVERGGNECLRLMRHRLSQRFPRTFANRLFEIYDLQASVPDTAPIYFLQRRAPIGPK